MVGSVVITSVDTIKLANSSHTEATQDSTIHNNQLTIPCHHVTAIVRYRNIATATACPISVERAVMFEARKNYLACSILTQDIITSVLADTPSN